MGNEIGIIANGIANLTDRIVRVRDLSDSMMIRARIRFDNGYEISAIRSASGRSGFAGSYSDTETVEIAIFTPDGEFFKTEEFPEYDDVLGYVDAEMFDTIARKVAAL